MTAEEKLSGDMLMLTTGFMMCAAALWLAIYWSMGYQYSTAIPLIFQGLSVITIGLYWKFRRIYLFAVIQLILRAVRDAWSIGNFREPWRELWSDGAGGRYVRARASRCRGSSAGSS
jgi:hypothetical protein